MVADLRESGGFLGLDFLRDHESEMSMRDGLLKIGPTALALSKQGKQTHKSMEIPQTMELVVTGIADNKLQSAGGSSALLTPSASLMTHTGVVVGASLGSTGTKHIPVVLLSPTDQSMFLRKRGTIGVLQSVPRIDIFSVSDGVLSCEGYVESGQEFSKSQSEQLPPALNKLP